MIISLGKLRYTSTLCNFKSASFAGIRRFSLVQ